jgi:hypothetical protein
MNPFGAKLELRQVVDLLRRDVTAGDDTVQRWRPSRTFVHLLLIVAGTGIYGAVMGCWRGSEQALYTALKFPLVVILTTLGNSLLNGMIAPLLGARFEIRQSLRAVLMSFMIAAVVMGALAPIVYFVVWNIPPPAAGQVSVSAYRFMQLVHVTVIAGAGIIANLNLFPLLCRWCQQRAAAYRVLVAWLMGNLFLGSQICWVLRPFIGRPEDPARFIGPAPFEGSLYETVFDALRHLIN